MKLTRPVSCPVCGGIVYIKDYRVRKTKDFRGIIFRYKIPRVVCTGCGKVNTVLPDILVPYKQYDRDAKNTVSFMKENML